jgi:hypothetical protein
MPVARQAGTRESLRCIYALWYFGKISSSLPLDSASTSLLDVAIPVGQLTIRQGNHPAILRRLNKQRGRITPLRVTANVVEYGIGHACSPGKGQHNGIENDSVEEANGPGMLPIPDPEHTQDPRNTNSARQAGNPAFQALCSHLSPSCV